MAPAGCKRIGSPCAERGQRGGHVRAREQAAQQPRSRVAHAAGRAQERLAACQQPRRQWRALGRPEG